jgi:hypothetical protein
MQKAPGRDPWCLKEPAQTVVRLAKGSSDDEALDGLELSVDRNHPHDAGHARLRWQKIIPRDSGDLGP